MRQSVNEVSREILTVVRKETTELFRDYRTILVSIGVPLLLFPLLFGIMSGNLLPDSVVPDTGVRVAIAGADPLAIGDFLSSRDELIVVQHQSEETTAAALELGQVDATVTFDHDSATNLPTATIVFDNTEPGSAAAGEYLTGLLNQFSIALARQRAAAYGVPTDLFEPLLIRQAPILAGPEGAGRFVLSFLVPLLVLVSAAIGPLASASDLGAGEKERGTLEPLLGSRVRRTSILLGKFAAVALMGFISIVSFFCGAALAFLVGPTTADSMQFMLGPVAVITVVLLAVLTAMVFAAVELTISFCARSAKAAQTFFLPVLILASAAGYAAFPMDIRSTALWNYHVPLLNIALSIKAAILGGARPGGLVITAVWAIAYVVVALLVARRVIHGESVLSVA